MEENYMVETEEEENTALAVIDDDELEEEEDGMSTGAAMALGGLLTVGVIAGGKWLWKKWKQHKEKKSLLTDESKKKAIDMDPIKEEPEEDEEGNRRIEIE